MMQAAAVITGNVVDNIRICYGHHTARIYGDTRTVVIGGITIKRRARNINRFISNCIQSAASASDMIAGESAAGDRGGAALYRSAAASTRRIVLEAAVGHAQQRIRRDSKATANVICAVV